MLLVLASLVPFGARASPRPVEVHQLLALPQPETKIAALTLDACGGGYDAKLIRFPGRRAHSRHRVRDTQVDRA